MYDLRHTGYIERQELMEMVLATLSESELSISDEDTEAIVDKTLQEANLNGDGKIDIYEWKEPDLDDDDVKRDRGTIMGKMRRTNTTPAIRRRVNRWKFSCLSMLLKKALDWKKLWRCWHGDPHIDISVVVNVMNMPNQFVIGSGHPDTNYAVMKWAFDGD